MHFDVHKFPVVEPRALQSRLIEVEAQWLDQVQLCAGIRAKTYDIAGIRWNLRLIEDKAEHRLFKNPPYCPVIVNCMLGPFAIH